MFYIYQEKPYPLSQPNLGHAFVINNLASEVPSWVVDEECLKSAMETVGFQVKAYKDCNVKVIFSFTLKQLQ